MLQLVLVLGSHQGHVGQVPQIREIKGAMMGRTVVTHHPGTVQSKSDRQILQADIVENVVIGALQKR